MSLRRSVGAIAAALLVVAPGCGGSEDGRPDIVFVSTRDGDYALYLMNAGGGDERRLTEHDANASSPSRLFFEIEPAWSPDGRRIAFSSRRSGTFDLYVVDAEGTATRRLTSTDDTDSHPTWSPDGRRIAFERDDDVFVMSSDGEGARRISDPRAEETEPAWSPDGARIAYVRREPGTSLWQLWLMRADGSERRRLTSQKARAAAPAWSPDGSRLAFSSNVNGQVYELFTIGVDGKGLKRVTTTAGDMFEPSWSPDGSEIAYEEDGAIFSIELGTREVDRLTDAKNNDSSPAWNPRPPPADE